MGIGSKLDWLIKEKGRNVNDVAKAAKVPSSTVYSIIKRDNTKADLDDLQRLAKELGVTLQYFVDDEEDEASKFVYSHKMMVLPHSEEKILTLYRKLNASGQLKVCEYTSDLVASGNYAESKEIDFLAPVAAHHSSYKGISEEEKKHDLDLLNDDDF